MCEDTPPRTEMARPRREDASPFGRHGAASTRDGAASRPRPGDLSRDRALPHAGYGATPRRIWRYPTQDMAPPHAGDGPTSRARYGKGSSPSSARTRRIQVRINESSPRAGLHEGDRPPSRPAPVDHFFSPSSNCARSHTRTCAHSSSSQPQQRRLPSGEKHVPASGAFPELGSFLISFAGPLRP